MGKAVLIPKDDQEKMKELFKINQFNLMASDLIALNRSLPDVRLEGPYKVHYWHLEKDSGDDDSPDNELNDLCSGSGSGYFEQESSIETDKWFSPDVALAMSTTPVVLPTMDIQPVGTPFEELPLSAPPRSQPPAPHW
ncbi:hypothetical protein G4228_018411 [Cervus hanglu yarkandensis]|nr:hypothetical protein G4228_018411 [Cervus hanglu yarkandensis]